MLSCTDLYNISAQLMHAFSDFVRAFGGQSVILAGDFAQLPPVGPKPCLYSSKVNAGLLPEREDDQQAEMGKALWHQFTMVVILHRNMSQTGMCIEDQLFRHTLENMRYKACTQDDFQLLDSCVVGQHVNSQSLLDDNFRYVSIITALNAHRDAINTYMCSQFAADHGQKLHYFHSIDTWPEKAWMSSSLRQSQRESARTVDPPHTSSSILGTLQKTLWNLPPCSTSQQAGILPLCVGMPVMLKSNEATELCATNGAEATVVEWDSHVSTLDNEILDTLFIKLSDPPRTVQVDELPPNVIPLTRSKIAICCSLPNDSTVRIDREQVRVLLNFAMSDYGSQGRTRPNNPCHLKHNRGHQSIYTVLSRSSSLHGTLILEGYDRSKLYGGASGALRTEF
ncbi:hypothetical protein BKA93DRAFT_698131, partial [Sparassis latifolia]